MVKPNPRNKSIATKVSEQEFARLEQAAQRASRTLGESESARAIGPSHHGKLIQARLLT